MKKAEILDKIFGVALVIVMVGVMLGGLGGFVNPSLAEGSQGISEDPFNYQGEYVIDVSKLTTPEEITALTHVQKYANEEAISPALLMALIKLESDFDPTAIGDGGLAIGYMQLHWDAAYDAGYRSAQGASTDYAAEDWPTDGLDPDANIKYGCGYLRIVYNQWGSSPAYDGDSLKNAISAYNLGRTDGPDKSNENSYVNPVLGYYQDYKDKYIAYTPGWGASHDVAVIDDYYGSAVGYLYPSDYPNQTFSTLSASQVSAETLASYDTVIMYMFNPSGLTAAQKAAIVSWISNSGKLIIWDSDQVPPGSPWDYSWLPYPFTTSVPGQQGATGKGLNTMEENQLSSSDPSSPYYIDTDALNNQTDAVGDANVLTSYSSGWQIDMMATNVLGETGPAHVYAGWGSGLIIYSALDWDNAGYYSGWDWGQPGTWLKKMLRQELDCSYLPFAAPPVPEEVGLEVQVTPKPPEGRDYYEVDDDIEFEVRVTNPTDETGISVTAYNVKLTVIEPEELEIDQPAGGINLEDIAPGGSESATFSGKAVKAGDNIEVIVNAIGWDDVLRKPIGGTDSCLITIHDPEAPKADWSFAIITDPHIGYRVPDYDGVGWCPPYSGTDPRKSETAGFTDSTGGGVVYQDDYGTVGLESVVGRIISEKSANNIEFVVVLGDFADTAEVSELWKAREILNRLNDPNGDGNTEDGIPYVPVIGDHDQWPYIQNENACKWPDPGLGPYRLKEPFGTLKQEATYAYGDEWFNDIFWGEDNGDNLDLIEERLGVRLQKAIGDILSDDGKVHYLQNRAFSYGGINFICLDCNPRTGRTSFAAGLETNTYQAARAFLEANLEDWEQDGEAETTIILSHHPLRGWGGFDGIQEQDIGNTIYHHGYGGKVYNFGGHVHYSDEGVIEVPVYNDVAGTTPAYYAEAYKVISTEAVNCEVPPDAVLIPSPTGEREGKPTIRIVQVNDGNIDYSRQLRASLVREVDIECPWFDINWPWHSLPEPGVEMTFTAHFTTYYGFSTSFEWNFGDESFGSGSSVTHTYSQEGDYDVTLSISTRNLITGEETTQSITGTVWVRNKHVISSLPPDLNATSLITEEDLTQVPKNTYEPTLVSKGASEETPIVELGVHFEEANEDVDLSSMVADVDLAEAKSVLYMPSWPSEMEEYKNLLIPSTGLGAVYICSNATSLDEVRPENADLIINVGETKNGITVITTYYNGHEYYLVSGITGTGGGEMPEVANTPPVANAGLDQTVFVIPPATTAVVTLDGSGSHDPDGDPLNYTWAWDNNTAHGVNPTIELPLGTTNITLVVNDGIVDSVPDTVNITVLQTKVTGGGGYGGGGQAPCYLDIDMLGEITSVRISCATDKTLKCAVAPDVNGTNFLEIDYGTTVICPERGEAPEALLMRVANQSPPVPDGSALIGPVYNFTGNYGAGSCSGVIFDQNVTIVLDYDPDELPESTASVAVAYYDTEQGSWISLPPATGRVAEIGKATGMMNHFSTVAVIAELAPAVTPASFAGSALNIEQSSQVWKNIFVGVTGKDVTITANVANNGGQEGTYIAELKLNEETIDAKEVTLAAGQSQQVTFTLYGMDYGQYEVEVAGLSGEFTVSRAINWLAIFGIILGVSLIIWAVIWGTRKQRKQPAQSE